MGIIHTGAVAHRTLKVNKSQLNSSEKGRRRDIWQGKKMRREKTLKRAINAAKSHTECTEAGGEEREHQDQKTRTAGQGMSSKTTRERSKGGAK